MFQRNRILIRNFLCVSLVSGLTGLLLNFESRDFLLSAEVILIAITSVSGFVLIVWILMIFDKDSYYPKIAIKNSAIAISTVMLFLAIQYFLIAIIGERFAEYHDQLAIKYCEQIGEIAEEYKTLNGEYPTWQTFALLDGKPRPPLLIEQEYSQYTHYKKKDNGRYLFIAEGAICSYDYRMEPPGATKAYYILNKEWSYSWHR